MSTELTPYTNLTPDTILTAIESLGIRCTGSLLALNSFENRVYQVGIEDDAPLIVKFYRPHRWSNAAIKEEHDFIRELFLADIPVVSPLIFQNETLHHHHEHRFALFTRKGGRILELENSEHVAWMGRFLGRLHAISQLKTFKNRPTLNVEYYGYQPYRFLINEHFIPTHLMDEYCTLMDLILAQIRLLFEKLSPINNIRLHGDFHAGNILWQEGPHIVDLDDCLMGPAIQDLWMLLPNGEEDRHRLNNIIEAYEEFNDFNYREIYLIPALRALRMTQYAAWLAKRWDDPAFPRHFPWFNTPRYWEEQVLQLKEQLALLEHALETVDRLH